MKKLRESDADNQFLAQKALEKSGEYLRGLLRKIKQESAQVPLNSPEKEGPYLCWIDVGLPDEVPPTWILWWWRGDNWFSGPTHPDPGFNHPYPKEWILHWQELPPKPAHL